MNALRILALLPVFGLIHPLAAAADDDPLRELALKLPSEFSKLMAANEEKFAGSTAEMVEACSAVADGLVPSLVALEMADASEAEKAEFQKEVERDAQGIAAGVYYSRHATGWGGTITRIEAAAAYGAYIETRICHAVTQRFQDDKTFDLEGWHKKWAEAGGSVGEDGDYAGEEAEQGAVRIEEGELRFARGSSGGMFVDSGDELAGNAIGFGARAGQRLVLACLEMRFRVEKFGENGRPETITPWTRACDLELPASKGGRYAIRFHGDDDDVSQAAQLLVEIR